MNDILAAKQISNTKLSISKGLPLTGMMGSKGSIGRLLIDTVENGLNTGITFLESDGSEMFFSYEQILSGAILRLGALSELGIKKGEPIMLVLDDNLEFVLCFWACVLGGIIPVPVSYPVIQANKNVAFEKLMTVYNLLDRPYIISDEKMALSCCDIETKMGIKDIYIISSKNLDKSSTKGKIEKIDPSDPAIYQFSSGSTSTPKGVILTHNNLLANIEAIINSTKAQHNDRVLSWLPLHHDMGLIGFFLAPTAASLDLINMAPKSFVKKPELWLDTVSRKKVSVTASPNFGYRLLLKKITQEHLCKWDLSCLRLIFNGAEPISVNIMNEFLDRLSVCGLKKSCMFTVYGMAEACLAVSFPPVEREPFVHCLDREKLVRESFAQQCDETSLKLLLLADEGYPVNGVEIRIVDSDGGILVENTVGEIQIKGSNVTKGYINNPDATRDSFQDGWLKTGDMGFIMGGRLTVTGRKKDIIFVNGQNFFAHDVEMKIEEIEGVEPGKIAVCAWHDDAVGCEKTALFSSLHVPKDEIKAFYEKILRFVNVTLALPLDYVILVRQIPKTTSGKVQRFILVKEFLGSSFHGTCFRAAELLAYGIQSDSNIIDDTYRNLVRQSWARVLEIPIETIPCDESFFSMGGNSIKAVQVLNCLENALETSLGYDTFMHCHTVNEIAINLSKMKFPELGANEEGVNKPGLNKSEDACNLYSEKEEKQKKCYYAWNWDSHNVTNSRELDPGAVVIFNDSNGIGYELMSKFDTGRNPVYFINEGDIFQSDKGGFLINPQSEDDYISALNSIPEEISAVIHLWNYSREPVHPQLTLNNGSLYRRCYSIVFAAKALIKHKLRNVKFLVLTENAFYVKQGDFIQNPEQSIAAVFTQVIGLENTEINACVFDVDNMEFTSNEILAQIIFEELHKETDGERIIAIRKGTRHIRNLKRIDIRMSDTLEVKDDETYLITGGAGSLGIELAKALAKKAKVNIILTGRLVLPLRRDWDKPISNTYVRERIKLINEIEELGADVLYIQADTANIYRMADLIEQIHSKYGAIHGVIHAAGVMDSIGCKLIDKDKENIIRTMTPKVLGTIVIDMLTRNEPLKFFAMISSVLASKGEWSVLAGDYAAANAYVSSYSYFRVLNGAPGKSISINASLINNKGNKSIPNAVDYGFSLLTPTEVADSYLKILASDYQGVIHI